MSDSSIVIVGAKRTPIGSLLGQFTGVPATVLGSTAIKAVPSELIDAARVDGATTPQVFWLRTLPQIAEAAVLKAMGE